MGGVHLRHPEAGGQVFTVNIRSFSNWSRGAPRRGGMHNEPQFDAPGAAHLHAKSGPTMKKEIKHPDKRVSTGSYSAAIEIDGWVFVSGQGPLDMKTGRVCAGTIEEETRLTMRHIGKILGEAGCTFSDVVRCGCHLADIRDFGGFNRAYSEFFSGAFPARTTVQSGLQGIKVEIDCIARRPGPRKPAAKKRGQIRRKAKR